MSHLIKTAAAGFLFAAIAMPAAAVTSPADCEYEGGEVFDLPNGAKVCMVPIRAEEFQGEEYDGQQLGVKSCDGEVTMEGEWCKVTLVAATPKPEPVMEEMDEMDEEMMEETN